jgi:hypothetical protein
MEGPVGRASGQGMRSASVADMQPCWGRCRHLSHMHVAFLDASVQRLLASPYGALWCCHFLMPAGDHCAGE